MNEDKKNKPKIEMKGHLLRNISEALYRISNDENAILFGPNGLVVKAISDNGDMLMYLRLDREKFSLITGTTFFSVDAEVFHEAVNYLEPEYNDNVMIYVFDKEKKIMLECNDRIATVRIRECKEIPNISKYHGEVSVLIYNEEIKNMMNVLKEMESGYAEVSFTTMNDDDGTPLFLMTMEKAYLTYQKKMYVADKHKNFTEYYPSKAVAIALLSLFPDTNYTLMFAEGSPCLIQGVTFGMHHIFYILPTRLSENDDYDGKLDERNAAGFGGK